MFEEMTDRIAGTLLTGLDAAVEFATLGEFRLVTPAPYDQTTELTAPALPLARRPERRTGRVIAPDLLPKPATAVGRAASRPTGPAAPAPLRLRPDADAPPLRLRLDREALRLDGDRAVLPHAPRRRPGAPSKPAHTASARVRAGSVPAGTQLCLFNR